MTAQPYSEEQLVEVPVSAPLAELGWLSVSELEEKLRPGGALQRETRSKVVLLERLRAALVKLNPAWPPDAIAAAVDGSEQP